MSKLFVYGSLKRGCSAHHLLEKHHAIFLERAISDSRYHIYKVGWFPGMVFNEDFPGGVHGEVYEVTEDCLEVLDSYEGVPHLFLRENIKLADGSIAIAYLYARQFHDCERYEEGVWQES